MIMRILENETYTGTRIYNKTWSRLKQKIRKNPTQEWVRAENAFEAIIDPQAFRIAQERLYWSMASRRNHGLRRVKQTERSLKAYVKELTSDFNNDRQFTIQQNLPLAYGLTYYEEGMAKRCFVIDENMRKHSEVLGISVNMFAKDKIDATFAIPTTSFGVGGYMIVDDEHEAKIDMSDARDKVYQLCEAIN
jgi:hypothetical protein